ncbi:MAG: hypothetical protein MJZ33_05190 [Paludibacteraceae bacterium]|nr:hypothetical protein [Paludibacteraceae bacterium]
MKRRKRKILVVVFWIIASLVMSVLPHHHHHEKICFERVECEMDHSVNDEHTGHETSDESHPDNCISSISFLPQHWLKLATLCLGISLLIGCIPFLFKNVSWLRIVGLHYSVSSFVSTLLGFLKIREGRAPPVLMD